MCHADQKAAARMRGGFFLKAAARMRGGFFLR
jgi:hypothetical protein